MDEPQAYNGRVTPRLKVLVAVASILCVLGVVLLLKRGTKPSAPVAAPAAAAAADQEMGPPAQDNDNVTLLYAHNLRLRQGQVFRAYIRWIRGKMVRSNPKRNASFDDPESFVLEIDKGVVRVKMQDIVDFLNSGAEGDAPLKKISMEADGDLLKVHGTVHKLIPLPVEITGQLIPETDGRVRFHVVKINVLKIPMKKLLGGLHVELSDLVKKTHVVGVQVVDNDIYFDTQRLLPPPHLRGEMTSVKVMSPDIEVIFGNAPNDESQLSQWHNFLRLRGGTVDFGKLTMRHTDLTMIDASKDEWFDLDLVNYQSQLVNGYSRITPQAGLEIFMPDVDDKAAAKEMKTVTLEWLKNRNTSVPEVPGK
ncbi:hypothetical protein SAMN05421771_3933 [Granulicella pectinivorans]|uniref:Uncharacterized protein n=1 Tax=Granulicella pectinivorans TaxID=474950 RepID=A0A1I6MYW3_9BACT|nr:hypothetical protein SAMN05421771_3933 [Granulicella pectinivorans]